MACRRSTMFQSTLPCGERPGGAEDGPGRQGVSIHAPVRGATPHRRRLLDGAEVSIHAPVRGATRQGRPLHRRGRRFNPRSRAGSDAKSQGIFIQSTKFQSTLPCGERPSASKASGATSSFQSTLPCGERPGRELAIHPGGEVSIHAPVRGATFCPLQGFVDLSGFNPRSRAGSDPPAIQTHSSTICFNPRSRAGSDRLCITDRGHRGKHRATANGGGFLPSLGSRRRSNSLFTCQRAI